MRLLIADDERLVRYHIRCLVVEADPAIEVLEAESGKELVELAEAGRFDVAFVDIRMPKMDGLQALRELSGRGRAIPWAVLSSHSEFEYAKRALELGALGYALKPPSAEEVSALVTKLRAAFERTLAERAQAFERDWARLAFDGAVALPSTAERSLFAAALLVADGVGTRFDVKARLAAITELTTVRARRHAEEGILVTALQRLEPPEPRLEVAVCAVASFSGEPDTDAMRRFWNELASAAATAESGSTAVQVEADDTAARAARITIVVAESAQDPTEARGALQSAQSILERRALLPSGVLEIREAERHLASFGTADLEAAVAVSQALATITTRDRNALREAAAAYDSASRMGIGDRAADLLRRFLHRSLSKTTPPLLTGASLIEFCEKAMIVEEDAGGGRREEGDTIAAVEEFVRRRFAERLSLAETARIFGLTPNYLSALFHRRVGMTFVEYATELRLSRARELLRAGKSVKEAAWAVGYGSERHFARLYRERFGSPPVEEKRTKTPPPD